MSVWGIDVDDGLGDESVSVPGGDGGYMKLGDE